MDGHGCVHTVQRTTNSSLNSHKLHKPHERVSASWVCEHVLVYSGTHSVVHKAAAANDQLLDVAGHDSTSTCSCRPTCECGVGDDRTVLAGALQQQEPAIIVHLPAWGDGGARLVTLCGDTISITITITITHYCRLQHLSPFQPFG